MQYRNRKLKKKSSPAALVLGIIAGFSLVAVFVFAFLYFSARWEMAQLQQIESKISEAEQKVADITGEKNDLSNKLSELESEINEIASLVSPELASVELTEQLQGLRQAVTSMKELDEKNKAIEASAIASGERILTDLLKDAPQRSVTVKSAEEGVPDKTEYVKSKVSVYYKDLPSGRTFGYNENVVMRAASTIKLPYVMSLLKAAMENPSEYDFSKTFIYNSETMKDEGSGRIKDMPHGTSLTHMQLMEYALKYSDSIAFVQLRRLYGDDEFIELSESLGVKNSIKSIGNISAYEAGLYLEAAYKFINEGGEYAEFFRDCLLKANHTVIIPNNVKPLTCLHKYGWDVDAYNDIAIVYGENSAYILAIYTDLDLGSNSNAVNSFMSSIVKEVNGLRP